MHPYRTHNCGELRLAHKNLAVRLSGWIHRKRDHGQLLFVDLRDHYGVTQCVIDVSSPLFSELDAQRLENVVTLTGTVVERSPETINPKLPTGDIELRIEAIAVLGAAGALPFPVNIDAEYPEDMRLKFRFLDLRREAVHANIMLRSAVIASLRRRMQDKGFAEFQTPILTASSPEGARDYLVPSRLHPGKFYALPQAPQLFKQLLMVAGFDRYFQIAPCFRDEASRADRSPGEFYQLDFEMSFVTQDDVFAAIEPVLAGVFEEFGQGRIVTKPPFPRIAYAEAMRMYGTDKPDLRNPIKMQDMTHVFRGSGFKVFANMIAADRNVRVWAIPASGGGNRAFCDRMNSWAQGEGQAGLGYIFWRTARPADSPESEGAGPIANSLGRELTKYLKDELHLQTNDAVFFVAGVPKNFVAFASAARLKLGKELNLVREGVFEFCWIVDFPMYEPNEETGKIEFSHNPFSMPNYDHELFLALDPTENREEILGISAFQYDIVCNGVELSSGAIRNHRPEIMIKAFEIAGYSAAEVEARFGGLLDAFRFGAPPHGGSAPGIDRIVMLLAGTPNLREIVAFPMNQQAEDLMMHAPAPVPAERLKELYIRLALPAERAKGSSEERGQAG
jgi:aspartyl-tRNA synthetase